MQLGNRLLQRRILRKIDQNAPICIIILVTFFLIGAIYENELSSSEPVISKLFANLGCTKHLPLCWKFSSLKCKTQLWFFDCPCLVGAIWISQQLLASCCRRTLFQCRLLCKSPSFPNKSWTTYRDPESMLLSIKHNTIKLTWKLQ